MYRIAFVCDWDAANLTAMSGASYAMRRAFLEAGHEVHDIFPAERDPLARAAAGAALPLKAFYSLQGRYHSPKRETAYLRAAAMFTERRLRRLGQLDFVFAQSGLPLALAKINTPIVFTADQPFDAYVKGYISNPSDRFLKIGRWVEKLISEKSSAIIFPSEWASKEFLRVHQEAAAKVRVIQWGANLYSLPSEREVSYNIKCRTREKSLNLVFIGRDWERKGGQLAVDVAQIFNSNGQSCKLTLIGVGGNVRLPPEIRGDVIPFIDKNSAYGLLLLNTILHRSHFLIVPSRQEAYGHVFCEAAAFGVPSVATAVGGIPSIIKDGENGICLRKDAPAEAYYQRMRDVFKDGQAYESMAFNAHASFVERLNWSTFASRIVDLVDGHLFSGKERA